MRTMFLSHSCKARLCQLRQFSSVLVAMWPLGLAFMLMSKVCIDDEYETIVFFSLFLFFFFKESVSD